MSKAGFQHQCRTPWIWWARLIGSRIGREWVCGKCGEAWVLKIAHMPYVPGAPTWTEWRKS